MISNNKNKVFHHGCSFTENLKVYYGGDNLSDNIFGDFDYENYGYHSSSNYLIFESFKKNTSNDSISIIQWSSLTRPQDPNYKILYKSENPLFDLLNEWYELLDEVQTIAKERNIKLFQYIGWAQWTDDELNEYHRNKLNSYGITWFESKDQMDIIASNCFQLQTPFEWSSNDVINGYHKWPHLKWGGMSEWIRENIEVYKRYVGWSDTDSGYRIFDPHPSKFASYKFIQNILIPKLNEFI